MFAHFAETDGHSMFLEPCHMMCLNSVHKFNRHTTRENDTCCVQQIHTLRLTRRGSDVTKVLLKTSRVTVRRVQSYDP